MPTAQEVYVSTVQSLPTSERLNLAKLILNDIPPESMVDYSTEWTDEDLEDFSRSGMNLIENYLAAEEDAPAR